MLFMRHRDEMTITWHMLTDMNATVKGEREESQTEGL